MAVDDRITISLRLLSDKFNRGLTSIKDNMDNIQRRSKTLLRHSLAFTAAAGGGAAIAVRSYQNFELAVAKVNKVADFGAQELEQYKTELRALAKEIPHSTTELAELSEAAAILGIRGSKDLLLFSKTVAKLGVATDVHGEEAAKSITRILQLSGEGVDVISNFGSAIVELGNNFKASESEILANAVRVRQATAEYKFSSAEILAMSTALRESGVRAELGGTAVGRSMRAMSAAVREGGDSLKILQELTGQTADELQVNLQDRPAEVFESFISGLGKLREQGIDTVPHMKALGLEGERILSVLPSLAKNSDRLTEALNRSKKAWEENSALDKEAAQFYATAAKRLELFWNKIRDLSISIGKQLMPAFEKLLKIGKKFIAFLNTPAMVKFIAWGLKASIVIGSLVSGIAALAIGIASATTAFTLFGGAIVLAAKLAAGATGIGLILLGAIALYKKWDVIWPWMQEKFELFAMFVINKARGLSKVLKGIYNLDLKQIKDGMSSMQKAYSDAVLAQGKDTNQKLQQQRKQDTTNAITAANEKNQKLSEIDKAAMEKARQEQLFANELKKEQDRIRKEEDAFAREEEHEQLRELEANRVIDIEGKKFEALRKGLDSKNALQRENAKKEFKLLKKQNEKKRKEDLQQQQNEFALMDAKVSFARASTQLITMAIGEGSKTAFYLSKALALTQIVIETAKGIATATAASAANPGAAALIPWIKATGLAQAAVVGAQTFKGPKGAQRGALVERAFGTPMRGDNQPYMLEPGEVVNPRRNYENLIEMEMAKRGALNKDDEDVEQMAQVVEISFQDDASDYIRAEQREKDALGIGVS